MYIDGYILPIKSGEEGTYREMASDGGKVWMKHGALQYVEAFADDLESVKEWGGLSFKDLVKPGEGETIVFAFIVFESKDHRDSVNRKVREEMEQDDKYEEMQMPFEMEKMAYGGFRAIVHHP